MNWLASPHWLNQSANCLPALGRSGGADIFRWNRLHRQANPAFPGPCRGRFQIRTLRDGSGLPTFGAGMHSSTWNRRIGRLNPFHLIWTMWNPALSHDNQWMAFVSGEQRKDDSVYVVGFPDASIRYVINQGHRAIHPFWHPSRNTLYYIDPDAQILYNTHFMPDPAPAFTPPAKVIDLPKNMFYGNRYFPRIMTLCPSHRPISLHRKPARRRSIQ